MLSNFWSNVTAPQATILAAVLAVVATVVGVGLSAFLFGNRVRDLKGALDRSDELLKNHVVAASSAFRNIEAQLRSLDDLSRTTTAGIGQLRGDIGDIGDAQTSANEPLTATGADLYQQASMKDNWTAIRDKLETTAAGSEVDGRTRAKYSRIDRRRYKDLVDAMATDGLLGSNASYYRQAIDIWSKYRSGRSTPTPADSASMKDLVSKLTGTSP